MHTEKDLFDLASKYRLVDMPVLLTRRMTQDEYGTGKASKALITVNEIWD
jgi:hypothetical protein